MKCEMAGRLDIPRDSPITKYAPSFCPLKDGLHTHRLVAGKRPSGLSVVMIRINESKHDTVHESSLSTPSYINEVEFHTVAVRRKLPFHAWPISGITIMR